jgi:hypothetical protein
VIEAIIVNHNTSPFAELCLRSLAARARSVEPRLRVTVVDNHSTDHGLGSLVDAAEEMGAPFERSRWPADQAKVNTHGDVLRDFVLARPSATFYLFLDADIVFVDDSTVRTMVSELDGDPDLWAIQARFVNAERHRGAGSSLDIGAGSPQNLYVGFEDPASAWHTSFPIVGSGQGRCHPGCALIKNSSSLQYTAARFGFATAVVMSADSAIAGYYDTMALASAVLSTHGLAYALSAATVAHYFNVSYDERTSLTDEKRVDALRQLATFRADPSGRPAPGPWG